LAVRHGIDARHGDGNEVTDTVTPLRAVDAFDLEDLASADLRAAGITMIHTSPGSGSSGADGSSSKNPGCTVEEMLVRASAAPEMAFGENPRRASGVPANSRLPVLAAIPHEGYDRRQARTGG
jgi:hypothetical protein